MITIDACGLSCPEPLIMASNAIKEHQGEEVVVLVDSGSARDNIETHALQKKKSVVINEVNGCFEIKIS